MDPRRLLAAYDAQLREAAETPSAISVTMLGPLRLVTFEGGRGFVTYRDLGGADADEVRRLVGKTLEYYRSDPTIARVEWKARGHDHAPGLRQVLIDYGFVEQETESIMIGLTESLAVELPLPDGVQIRHITDHLDVLAMCEMDSVVFHDPDYREFADALCRRLATGDGMELWVAEAKGEIVSAGRLEPVPDSDFAGIWGGATREDWRHRGVYRALTAARARSALRLGKTLINSDSTEYSRLILERSGLIKVSTTTPYVWRR